MLREKKNTPYVPEIQPIVHDSVTDGISVSTLRLDKIHPYISGNKYFKLKYNVDEASHLDKTGILTFGGAYSNHLLASAYAAKNKGLNAVGIVRGEELNNQSNSTLRECAKLGMELHFISREDYRKRNDPLFQQTLHDKYPDFYLVPEGGSNALAVKGCMEIWEYIPSKFTHVLLAVGTGGTLSGLIAAKPAHVSLLGIPVLKGADFLANDIDDLLSAGGYTHNPYSLNHDYHFGGYAKTNQDLQDFIVDFKKQTQIPIEHVYTGKMFYALFDLVKKGFFPQNSSILAIHTGGLRPNDYNE